MEASIIVAFDQQRGIGKNNDLMWHLPADMKFFKETTRGAVVVMGRKNYESIPEKFRPLPQRENVILTRNEEYKAPGAQVFTDFNVLKEAYSGEDRKVFIIGGGEIYKMALDAGVVKEMFITHVNASFDADTFFPDFDLKDWKVSTIQEQAKDEKHKYSFKVLHYLLKK